MATNDDNTITLEMLKDFVPTEEEEGNELRFRQAATVAIQRIDASRSPNGVCRREYMLEDEDGSASGIHAHCTKSKAIHYQMRLLQLAHRRARGAWAAVASSRRDELQSPGDKRLKGSQEAGGDVLPFPQSGTNKRSLEILNLLIEQGGDASILGSLKEIRRSNVELCQVAHPFIRSYAMVGVVGGVTPEQLLAQTGQDILQEDGPTPDGKGSGCSESQRVSRHRAATPKGAEWLADVKHKNAKKAAMVAEAQHGMPSVPGARRPAQIENSRVPPLFPSTMVWNLSVSTMLDCRRAFLCVTTLYLGYIDVIGPTTGFNDSIAKVKWPPHLRNLYFGANFRRSINNVTWPKTLVRMEFGGLFDRPIVGVKWPVNLQQLTLETCFNQRIDHVIWPEGLQELTLGSSFNQYFGAAQWPASLTRLEVGNKFNKTLVGVGLPSNLRQLFLGDGFKQPIHDVLWPSTLQEVVFGAGFDQPVSGVSWPPSLARLTFGTKFDQPIDSVIWPNSLEQLRFGDSFNQPLMGVTWPNKLRHLSFGRASTKSLAEVLWPPCLEEIEVEYCTCSGNPMRLNLGGHDGVVQSSA